MPTMDDEYGSAMAWSDMYLQGLLAGTVFYT